MYGIVFKSFGRDKIQDQCFKYYVDVKENERRFRETEKVSARMRYAQYILRLYIKLLSIGYIAAFPVKRISNTEKTTDTIELEKNDIEETVDADEKRPGKTKKPKWKYIYEAHDPFLEQMETTIVEIKNTCIESADAARFPKDQAAILSLLKRLRAHIRADQEYPYQDSYVEKAPKQHISGELRTIWSISPWDYSLQENNYSPRPGKKAIRQWVKAHERVCYCTRLHKSEYNDFRCAVDQIKKCIDSLHRKEISTVRRFLDAVIYLQNTYFICQYGYCEKKLKEATAGVPPRRYRRSSKLRKNSTTGTIIGDVWKLCCAGAGHVSEKELFPYVREYYKRRKYRVMLCRMLLRNARQYARRHNLPPIGRRIVLIRDAG